MIRKNTVIITLVVAVFLIAGVFAVVHFRKPPSPVGALIPHDAGTALFLESELFTHPVSSLFVKEIMQDQDLATVFFSGVPSSRGSFFLGDTGWVILSETELTTPLLHHDTVNGVFVYAEKEEGIDVVRKRAGKVGDVESSYRSFVRFDWHGVPALSEKDAGPVAAEIFADGTSLLTTFTTSIDALLPDVAFLSFIPPRGTVGIPITAPIGDNLGSLLGYAIAFFGSQPQGVVVMSMPSSDVSAVTLLWPKSGAVSPNFAEEQVVQLAERLADQFPRAVPQTLPDGSTAQILMRDKNQFKPTTLDGGAVATLSVGTDTLAISSVLHGRTSWVVVGNTLGLVRGVRESLKRLGQSDQCASLPDRTRMVFHLESGLIGAIDANGKHAVFCSVVIPAKAGIQ
ncbi:MAG: hypothetical protein Q7S89_01430 [bacterium]|nr:hypothetical protein [bacterium]